VAKARFLREARTAARLDHPGIVRVLDVNEESGTPFIVMEFVDGIDLSALLKQHGMLDGIAALRALAQVADGLAHAHAEGIVHRDIKPHNVFAARDGRVKLGDFGLARPVEQTSELTVAGAALGTSYYMSPEQAEGREVDQRSDIYSLGVTAWHLLTGEPPFIGTTPVSIAVQHVNKDIPYDRAKFGHLPDPAVYLLISMTSRDPAKRPPAREVCERLQQILAQATGSGATRLARLEELVPPKGARRDVITQTLPVLPHQPMPPQPLTPSPPPVTPFPPYVPPRKDNTMLWVAVALIIVLLTMFAGCVMALASSTPGVVEAQAGG
jgi:serine/threonine-protein kinase